MSIGGHSDDEKTLQIDNNNELVDLEKKETKRHQGRGVSEERVRTDEQEAVLEDEDDFPDGGWRAWLVVLGAALGNFGTFGYVNAWGIFQTYYEQNILRDTSPSTIAWIGSIQYALVFLPGLVMGRLFDIGILHGPLLVASVLLVVSTILVAECHQFWQFLLCQGFAVGLFGGIVFGPLVGVVSHWFKRRKATALGLMALGSSMGGTLFPIAVHNLIEDVGFRWTMRIVALLLLVTLAVTNLTVARRLPPRDTRGPFFDLREFNNIAYSVYCIAGFTTFLGLYTVLTYIDVSAAFVGIDRNLTFYLVSIANAGSGLGRVGGGIMVDRWGSLNVMIPFTVIAAGTTFGWPFITSKGGYIALALVYGAASGVYASMLSAPIVTVGGTHDVGLRVGMFFTLVAMGALAGPPISGAINDSTGNYKATGYYAGASIIVSVILMIITRQIVLGNKLRGRA